jgi:hypothetical protein
MLSPAIFTRLHANLPALELTRATGKNVLHDDPVKNAWLGQKAESYDRIGLCRKRVF